MKGKVAAAFFVRTPGHSEAKSRLAESVGGDVAAEIYEASLDRCRELAEGLAGLGAEVVWAVAEPAGVDSERWTGTGFESVLSGEGDLGECLANVYGKLRRRAETAVLLGSDSPQLMLEDVRAAWEGSGDSSMVVGPATDGGFYLFAGRRNIQRSVWESVEYSMPNTLNRLEVALRQPLRRLSKLTDFDDLSSLLQVLREMPAEMSPAQERFAELAKSTLRKAGRSS